MTTDDEPFFTTFINGRHVRSPKPSELVKKVSGAFIFSHVQALAMPLRGMISVPFGQRINYAQRKYRKIVVSEVSSSVKMTVVNAFVEPLVEPYIQGQVLKTIVSGAITVHYLNGVMVFQVL